MPLTKKGRKRNIKHHAQIRRKKPRTWCQVYVLKEADGDKPFYVGQTRSLPDERLRWHFKEIDRRLSVGAGLSPCQRRIWAMRERDRTPVIEIIDADGHWDISEAVWIDRLTREGAQLANVLSRIPHKVARKPLQRLSEPDCELNRAFDSALREEVS